VTIRWRPQELDHQLMVWSLSPLSSEVVVLFTCSESLDSPVFL
jgi:hypothetical protein